MPDPITARVEPPSPSRPPRPEMYALAVFAQGSWTIYFAGGDRKWIESMSKYHEGSHLIVIPGEEVDNG